MNRKGIEYSVLERDVQSSKQIYESLLQRAKETGVSGELKTSNIRVVDEAERPRTPVSPRKALNLLLGAGVGHRSSPSGWRSSSSTSTAASRRRTRSRRTSGCRRSAWCRRSTPRRGRASEPLMHAGVPPGFAEAFRTIRTNVLFSSAEEGSRVAGRHQHRPRRRQDDGGEQPGDWLRAGRPAGAARSTPTCAGRACTTCSACKQEPGLSNLMVGNAKASESVRKTRRARAVGAGRRPHSAEPGGAARLAALPRLPEVAEGALRLDHHRLAAGHGGDRRGDRGATSPTAWCSSSAPR